CSISSLTSLLLDRLLMSTVLVLFLLLLLFFFFFFNDPATTEIYTLSLHDALPIYVADRIYDACFVVVSYLVGARISEILGLQVGDRKSTRLNSSHLVISYAVFCLKKKNKNNKH